MTKEEYGRDENAAPAKDTTPSRVGDIVFSPLGTPREGTLVCDGSAVSRQTYKELFDFLGVSCGEGDGETTFNLPAKFYIDLSYAYQSRIDLGNIWVMPNHFLQAGVKKRFGERFVLSFSARNLLDQGQKVGAAGEGFVRTVNVRKAWSNIQYNFGVTWNFKSGKAFNRKSVEAASAEDKGRMEKK